MSSIHPSGNIIENESTTPFAASGLNSDPTLFKLYQTGTRRHIRNDMTMPLIIIVYLAVATRFNLGALDNEGPFFTTAFVCLAVGTSLFIPYLVTRLIVHHTPSDIREASPYYERSVRFQQLAVRLHLQNIMCLLSVTINGFVLLGRVYAGSCHDETSIWTNQMCNPYADVASIPPDQVMLVYLAPLTVQLIIRGISVKALMITWLMGLAFVAIASAHVGGYQQLWILSYSVFFMVIMFMIEELNRTTFMQGQAMTAASAASLKQELVLMEMTAIVDEKLKEKEVHQLKSLMGNVAHDLKTPLHSIEADLEMIQTFVSRIPKSALDVAREDLRVDLIKDNIDIYSIINSLKATCQFMGMSINRSQDFMKSSNNIALVPLMETFELQSALDMSVTCLNHLDSGKSITLHPLSADICPQIISDKHWISENTLCLLSNAVKYSDDGCIDVRMKLVDVCITDDIPPKDGKDCNSKDSKDEIRTPSSTIMVDGETVYITMRSMTTISTLNADLVNTSSRSLQDVGFMETTIQTSDKKNGPGSGSGTGLGSGSESAKMVMITVEDNGIGIPEEKRSQLFQPFAQAQRMAGGTGLGLYSLAKRMEALGGECGVYGRTDGTQGSMFWFTFPYRPDASRRDDVADDDSLPAIPADFVKPKHILIIDDSPSILKVTARMLTMNGHTVTTATNGSEGLKMMKRAYSTQEYDMVLTDIQMPVMDGIEATRRYREFEEEEMALEKEDNNRSRSEIFNTIRTIASDNNDYNGKVVNMLDRNINNDGDNDNDVAHYIKSISSRTTRKDRSKVGIVGMSANSDSLTEQEAFDCGMDYFLPKPFAYNNLLIIFKHLNGSGQPPVFNESLEYNCK